jgi:DNA-binding CsgD family transcriptional regulator
MKSRRARLFVEMLDHVYAGVTDPARRELGVGALVQLLGGIAGSIREGTHEGASLGESVGLDAKASAAYTSHWWRHDPWAVRVWEPPAGSFSFGERVCPRAHVERSAFHNDFARDFGMGELALGLLARSPDRVVGFGVFKPYGRQSFSVQESAMGILATPHFARAFALREQLDCIDNPALQPAAARFIGRKFESTRQLEDELRTRFRLSAAEARVAVRIGAGLSPKEIAAQLGTSWNTVRTQLRAAFAKLEVKSQSELVRGLTLLELRLARSRALR